ncbi:MAG: undecaprenyldiphospho-muramoylpentapeptide beta-N-acetylglucosaminyltransferase [Clostridia bacterium]|nr:undecaprenyldiphospho-muramoylpentapeptide beta-N-acetylglucosaminyltransferase [Clostridia bacterium]
MRILLAGGGTAGHIQPALAIAACIRQHHPQAEFLFVGVKGKMEASIVPKAGYDIRLLDVQGFEHKRTLHALRHNIKALFQAGRSGSTCRRILKEFRPDVAIGTGGYVCGPILRAAGKAGIPVILHESNAFPGVTVKMLVRYATLILVGDESAVKRLPAGAPVQVTGNPIRPQFLTLDKNGARQQLELDSRPVILSVGGSLGARAINNAMAEVICRNQQEGFPVQIIHSAGHGGYENMCRLLEEKGVRTDDPAVRVRGYIDDMPRCMAAADVVVSRCGAMTLSELPAAGKPAVLIPSPYVAENHQYYNAMALVDKGAAVCIEEKDLTGEKLWETLWNIVSSPEKMRQMAASAKAASVPDAAERIYDAVRPYLPG